MITVWLYNIICVGRIWRGINGAKCFFNFNLTQVNSRSFGEGITELGIDSSIAIKTPPPRVHLSFR